MGQVVNLQAWAVITDPQNLPSEDSIHDVVGSFLGTGVGPGPVAGDLAAAVTADFSASGSQNGTPQDLNGDGNIDVGSNVPNSVPLSVTDYFFARSSGNETSSDGTIVGNALEFEIGTLTYTVTNVNLGGETDIAFFFFMLIFGQRRDLGKDNQPEDNTVGTFVGGAPFVVTDPAAQPPPIIVDDTASTVLNAPVTKDVLANDPATYAALDPSTVAIVTHPSNGNVAVNPDGTIEYIPVNGFIGSDSFTYTVNDVNGKTSNAATVDVSTGLGLSSAKGGIKSVTYTDADGTVATISLNIGQASLAFSGGGTATIKGTKASLGGTNTINGITLSSTSKSSTLSITGKGGDGSVSIASIDDTAPMGKINAPILNLTGTSTLDGLTSLQAKQLNGSSVTIGSGTSSAVSITSPTITGATISAPSETVSLVAGSVTSSTISALSDKTIKVTGATSETTFASTGTAVAGVLNLTGDVSSSILSTNGAFKNQSAGSLTATTLTSGPISALHVKGAVTNSNITFSSSTSGPIHVAIGGAVTNSSITSAGTLSAVSAGSFTGSTVTSAGNIVSLSASSVSGSTILAGTANVSLDTVTAGNLGTATIQKINVAKTFSDSTIIAQTISSASLGTVSNTSGTTQGIGATNYKSASLKLNGKSIHLASKQLALITALQAALTAQNVTVTQSTTDAGTPDVLFTDDGVAEVTFAFVAGNAYPLSGNSCTYSSRTVRLARGPVANFGRH